MKLIYHLKYLLLFSLLLTHGTLSLVAFPWVQRQWFQVVLFLPLDGEITPICYKCHRNLAHCNLTLLFPKVRLEHGKLCSLCF